MRFSKLFISLTALLFLTGNVAATENWPSKPIKLVVPFSAGGSADTLGRLFANVLSEKLAQQVYVENRPGAGGMVASAQVAKSDPDGYTLLVSGVASHAIGPALNAKAGYDPIRSFTHIAYLGGPPVVWVVHPSMKATSLQMLVDILRAKSVPTPYGSPGPGTQGHLVAAYMAGKEGLKIQHVPYKGAGPAMADIAAGHINFGSVTWTTALGHIQAGLVKPIAISTDSRLPDFPDVPTFKELGYPDVVATTWFSISGPAGMPQDIVARLNSEFINSLDRADVKERLKMEGITIIPMNAGEFSSFVEKEVNRWGPIATSSGAKVQ